MNIAIYGGSFDPIHNAHVSVVESALKNLDIDRLIILPTFLNPFKNSSYIDASLKLELLKELFSDYEKVIVSDFEIKCAQKVPTIRSVKHFYELYDVSKMYLIIGADNLKSLNQWNSYEKLLELVEIVVATREPYNEKHPYRVLHVDQDISSSSLRKEFKLDDVPPKIANKLREIYEQKSR